ncbi:MAG: hypothetical protein Aurels2KO_25900 [Aureliella sp.]
MAELTLVGTSWIAFVQPPQPTVELAAKAQPFVWVDTNQASISRDVPLGNVATTTETACDYQNTMLLGKIANTTNWRCLSSSLTLAPSPLARITGHLSRLDNLSPSQPRLDKALAEIGVTHRLIRRSTQSGTLFGWQAVANPRPLCNLVRLEKPVDLSWNWERCDLLSIHATTSQANLMVVRQYNDGGWRVVIEPAKDHPTPDSDWLEVETTELGLIQLRVPPGEWNILLSRKLFW